MIENTNTKQFYPGPIQNKTLEITEFLFTEEDQIKVTKTYTNESGVSVDEVLTPDTDYEVTKILPNDVDAANAALTASTGTVTLKDHIVVSAGQKITIYRSTSIVQDVEYPRTGPFPAATHEGALDYITMQNQEQQDDLDRSLKVPVSTQGFTGTLPPPTPARALKINSAGTGFELSEYDPDEAMITTKAYKDAAEAARDVSIAQATIATDKAAVSTDKATIATDKAAHCDEMDATITSNYNTYKADLAADHTTYKNDLAQDHSDYESAMSSNHNSYETQLYDTKVAGIQELENTSNALTVTNINQGVLEDPCHVFVTTSGATFTIKIGTELVVPYGKTDLGLKIGEKFLNDKFEIIDTDYNGSQYFVYLKTLEDISQTVTSTWGTGTHLVSINIPTGTPIARIGHQSGSSTTVTYSLFYNTDTNYISDTQYTSYICSFPLFKLYPAPATPACGKPLELFDNMGYIGKHVWVRKGLKLAFAAGKQKSNGHNYNIVDTLNHTLTLQYSESNNRRGCIFLERVEEDNFSMWGWGWSRSTNVIFVDSLPATAPNTYVTMFSTQFNRWFQITNSTNMSNVIEKNPMCLIGCIYYNDTNTCIAGLERSHAFTCVNNNMPSLKAKGAFPTVNLDVNRYTYTAATTGTTYIARYTGYIFAYMVNATACNLHNNDCRISSVDFTGGGSQDRYGWIPVTAGDSFSFYYSGTVKEFINIPCWDAVKSVI